MQPKYIFQLTCSDGSNPLCAILRTTRWVVVVLEWNMEPSFALFSLDSSLLRGVKDLAERLHTSAEPLPQVRLPASSTDGRHRWDDVRGSDWREIFRGFPGEEVQQAALQGLLGSLTSVFRNWQSVFARQGWLVQRVLWISPARLLQPRMVDSPFLQ